MTRLSNKQPYPGLRPYDSGDEDFFFGRETQIRGLRQKMETSRLVAVVGRSGCGKSSLVRAGLVPVLGRESGDGGEPIWHIASFRPRGRPIAELTKELWRLTSQSPSTVAQSSSITPEELEQLRRSRIEAMLRRSSLGLVETAREIPLRERGRILIIVDQFEEIFRYEDPTGNNTDEATAFVRLLMEAINADHPRIVVILTMRLDFLGDCARFARLPESISDGQFLVPNLSRAERRAAIEEPAKKAGKPIRPEVTQRLLNEIGDDPDQLPVLQHVLMRMWQCAESRSEITLSEYTETGGVKEAISRHADQIYESLPNAGYRLAAERLFKAISERDRRGRSIRRATSFGTIASIVAGDDETISLAESQKKLLTVIEAFRASECSFLMPPAGEDIVPSTLIDISHESLLRGWIKLTGVSDKGGWIAEEVANGEKYDDLLEDQKRGYVFPESVADARQRWWQAARPNAAWAERYGNDFPAVKAFLESVCEHHRKERDISRIRNARMRNLWIAVSALGAVLAFVVFAFLVNYKAIRQARLEMERAQAAQGAQEQVAQENSRLAREYSAKLDQAQADIKTQKDQLEQLKQEIDRTVQQAQKAGPQNDQKVRQDLNNLVKSTALVTDATNQRAIIDTKGDTYPTLTSTTGFMWIGSMGSSSRANLNAIGGAPVLPGAVKVGDQYVNSLDIYLRQGPPGADYTQQATVGIMPEGTRVQIVDVLPPFQRSSGDQYWAKVHVVQLALSSVFFQFAGGSRDQAQALSRALQEKGYKIPGEERTADAAGKHEVRYFFNGQSAIAGQLAADTNQVLKKNGYSLSVNVVSANKTIRSNPDGKLELWLDIPSR